MKYGQDGGSRSYALGASRSAHAALRKARRYAGLACQPHALESTATLYRRMASDYAARARREWHRFLLWRRIYRATEAGNGDEARRLLEAVV